MAISGGRLCVGPHAYDADTGSVEKKIIGQGSSHPSRAPRWCGRYFQDGDGEGLTGTQHAKEYTLYRDFSVGSVPVTITWFLVHKYTVYLSTHVRSQMSFNKHPVRLLSHSCGLLMAIQITNGH